MILQVLLLSHYILGTSIDGADGINFEDNFKNWEETQWHYDRQGFRHCGTENCFLTTSENLEYFVNLPKQNQPSFESNELTISMRNDCEDEFCCRDDKHCTSYTSGQITSDKLYGYGSFHFNLRTAKQTEEYKVESTTFKSVKCTSNPKPEEFQNLLSQIPSRGYCVNNEADLENFSSNRDLCQGVGRNICSRSTWTINTLSTGVFNFKATSLGWRCLSDYDFISGVDYEQRVFPIHVETAVLMETCKQICKSELNACVAFAFQKHPTQKICAFYEKMGELTKPHHEEGEVCIYGTKAIDYDSAAIYLDGRIVSSGGRDLIQDFDVTISKVGRHKIQLYAYEECCSGSSRHGYGGWTLAKKANKVRFKLPPSAEPEVAEGGPSDAEAGGSSSVDLANLNLGEGGISGEATDAGNSDMDDADSEVGAPIHPVIETSEKIYESTEEPEQTTTEELERQPGVQGEDEGQPGSGTKTAVNQEEKKPIPLIIDCDAGFDDSMGVVIAMHFHRLGQYRLKAVTISNGNTQEDHPWNAIHVIVHEIFQQHDIPIYRMPPRRDEMVDFPFYGIDGHYGQVERYLQTYGGMTFPDTNIMNSQQYLCQQLMLEPNLVILVTGPLTNLNVCHHLIKPTHRIFMMGGAIDVPGNVPAAYRAEFNFATDPDAVRNVISHGNSVIIPLDCKMRFFTDRVTNALKEKKNRFLIEVFKRFRQQVYRAVNGKEHDHECTEECISIYDAVASFVTYLTLFGGPIQLGQKSVTIDGSGAVIPGEHSVQYCASNSLDPLVKLREVRAAGTDTLIAALQAATKDFNESPPTIAPTMPPAHVSARNYEPHSHSHDLGSTSRDSPWMERSDGESDAEDHHVTENPDFIGGRPIFDHSERTRLRDPSSSGEDWMERSGGAAGSTSVDYSGGDSSSHSNPDSSYPDTSYPDTPRSGNPGNPAYHFPVEDEDAPRYYDGGEISDSGPYRDDTVHGGNIFGPPPSSSPTMNQSPSSSRRPDSALSLYRYGANYCIQLMRRTVGRMTSGLFMRISMCFHSWNTRSATLAVRYGEETWKQEAELPFDTSSKIGRYGIQWVPDRITWTVDGVKIGEVLHKAVDIPDSPLHIKIFVAPTVPRQDMKDLIEHQLHLYLADYEKLEQNKSKDELIVLGDSVDYSWRLWLLVFSLCVAVGIWFLWQRRKHQTVDGYILLEEDFNQI